MTTRGLIGTLLLLQNVATDEQAEALISRLADPHTRAVVRAEWRELQAASVQTITTGSPA